MSSTSDAAVTRVSPAGVAFVVAALLASGSCECSGRDDGEAAPANARSPRSGPAEDTASDGASGPGAARLRPSSRQTSADVTSDTHSAAAETGGDARSSAEIPRDPGPCRIPRIDEAVDFRDPRSAAVAHRRPEDGYSLEEAAAQLHVLEESRYVSRAMSAHDADSIEQTLGLTAGKEGIDVTIREVGPDGETSGSHEHTFSTVSDFLTCLRDASSLGESYARGATYEGTCRAPDDVAELLRLPRWHGVSEIEECDDGCCTFARPPRAPGELAVRRACLEELETERPRLESLQLVRAPTDETRWRLRRATWRFLKAFTDPDADREKLVAAVRSGRTVVVEQNAGHEGPAADRIEEYRIDGGEGLSDCKLGEPTCEPQHFLAHLQLNRRVLEGCAEGCCQLRLGGPGGDFDTTVDGLCFEWTDQGDLGVKCIDLRQTGP